MKAKLILLAATLAACTPSPSATATTAAAPTAIPATATAAPATATSVPATAASTMEPVVATPTAPAESKPDVIEEEVMIEAADGLTMVGTFYTSNASQAQPGVLLLHQLGSNRFSWRSWALEFAESGYALLAIDMRGHGRTGGARDWDAAADDLQRVWRYLSERPEVDASRSAIIGASIGSNMALVTAAAEPRVNTVVLLSPGLDYFGVTTDDAIVAYGDRPILIVASNDDPQSAQSSQTLADLASDAQLQIYETAGHGIAMLASEPELIQMIIDWLDQHVQPQTDEAGGDVQDVAMVLVAEGSFTMGSQEGEAFAECESHFSGSTCQPEWYAEELPAHRVTLDAFYIDQYEATNEQYAACVDAAVCDVPDRQSSSTRSSYFGNTDYDDYPVIWVSWGDANDYCVWRDARLPSEAEWEKAARGDDGRLYPWGNTFDGNFANFCDNNCIGLLWINDAWDDGFADTSPVGQYADGVSPYGAYDMAGNVDEWASDWFDEDYYADSPSENPTGPESGVGRVIRGGAWHGPGNSVRTTGRPRSDPSADYIGIRCARDA